MYAMQWGFKARPKGGSLVLPAEECPRVIGRISSMPGMRPYLLEGNPLQAHE